MSWMKRPRPSPIDLGATHLNTITTPSDRGYAQAFASRATRAQGYPFEGQAGVLDVLPWRTDGSVITRFVSQNSGIATRYWLAGAWSGWKDAMGQVIV